MKTYMHMGVAGFFSGLALWYYINEDELEDTDDFLLFRSFN
ncbi:hypothetical protein [Daejeonella oryzae]|nr:hypothetical protein [Daejeonella oryzae]